MQKASLHIPEPYKDLRDTIGRAERIMDDAVSLRRYRLSAAYERRKVGGGNWSIPILCFVALESLGTIHWLLHNEGMLLSGVDAEFLQFLSSEEKGKLNGLKKDCKIGAASRFWALVQAAHQSVGLTFPADEVSLREIWETFRNVPVHNAAFRQGTGGAVFYKDGLSDRKIESILADHGKMVAARPLFDGDKPVPWMSFYREEGSWRCFGDILAVEVRKVAEWLALHSKDSSPDKIADVLEYVAKKLA